MNELIKVTTNEKQEQTVSARELYERLGLDKSHWKRWYNQNITNNEFFIENVDYATFAIMVNGNETIDFALKLDMAKELCMLCRNEKGKEIRQYFIEIERQHNAQLPVLPQTYAEALRQLADTIEEKRAS